MKKLVEKVMAWLKKHKGQVAVAEKVAEDVAKDAPAVEKDLPK